MSIIKRYAGYCISSYVKHVIIRPNNKVLTLRKMSTQSASDGKRIVWVDLEMTGLDVQNDQILEIACLVTDADLNVIAEGTNIVIHQSEEILKNMNTWCVAQHGESGLTKASLESKVSLADAEEQVLKYVRKHAPENKCPMGGNSIYMDKIFLQKYMPKLNQYMHYRVIDVSTIKELAKRWYPKEASRVPQKKFEHRCLNDILDSIEELKYYKEHIFKNQLIS